RGTAHRELASARAGRMILGETSTFSEICPVSFFCVRHDVHLAELAQFDNPDKVREVASVDRKSEARHVELEPGMLPKTFDNETGREPRVVWRRRRDAREKVT